MKKIILTEEQTINLMGKIIDEQNSSIRAIEYGPNEGRYAKKLRCSFSTHNLFYNGNEIIDFADEIPGVENFYINVSYLIDIEHSPFGITDIKITDIKGPDNIKIPFEYLANDNVNVIDAEEDDISRKEAIIPLNWRKIRIIDSYDKNYFGLDDNIEIIVINNGSDQFTAKELIVKARPFKKE